MSEAVTLILLIAWMWREYRHEQERRALLAKIGVQVAADKPSVPRRAFGTDRDEWLIEQERLGNRR